MNRECLNTNLLIKNATIIDGAGKEPFLSSVHVKGNKINKIGDFGSENQFDKVIDATGLYLLPGMIDCHVHVMINKYNMMEHMNTPFSLNFYKSISNLKKLLHAGITTARDAGGADLGVKMALKNNMVSGPKLKISISPLSITGGHIDAWMPSGIQPYLLNPPYPGNPSGICDGVDEVRKRVREVLRSGADVIKICSTGGVMSPTDDPEYTQFSCEELRTVVQEGAMRKGVKVMAHAQGLQGIKNAIKSGVYSIEHGIYLDDEAIDLMLEKEVFLVPTFLAIHAILDGDYPENIQNEAKKVREIHQRSIEKAYKSGVKIAMGTDSGIMAHGRNLEELKLMCEVGISPMDAIIASTQTAARCLEVNEETGTISEGKLADLILIKENPIENIGSLSDLDNFNAIFQDGREITSNI